MDDQLEAVRQDTRSVKDKIVKMEQDLAIAKQSGNKGGERGGEVSSRPAGEAG